jgi:hypothetical protein
MAERYCLARFWVVTRVRDATLREARPDFDHSEFSLPAIARSMKRNEIAVQLPIVPWFSSSPSEIPHEIAHALFSSDCCGPAAGHEAADPFPNAASMGGLAFNSTVEPGEKQYLRCRLSGTALMSACQPVDKPWDKKRRFCGTRWTPARRFFLYFSGWIHHGCCRFPTNMTHEIFKSPARLSGLHTAVRFQQHADGIFLSLTGVAPQIVIEVEDEKDF